MFSRICLGQADPEGKVLGTFEVEEVAQWVKMLVVTPDGLSLILRTRIVQRTDSHKPVLLSLMLTPLHLFML